MCDKAALRREIRAWRASLPAQRVLAWSEAIRWRVENMPQYRRARRILFYASLPGEVETLRWLAAPSHQEYFLPVCMPDGSLRMVRRRRPSLGPMASWNLPRVPRLWESTSCWFRVWPSIAAAPVWAGARATTTDC